MAAERSFRRSDLWRAALAAVVGAAPLAATTPAWSGPVADANVIVDLSVIDDLNAARPSGPVSAAGGTRLRAPLGSAPTSRLHAGALATMGIAAPAPGATGAAAAQPGPRTYGRLIADWPPRTAADLRRRSATPINPLTRKAAHLLAHVDPAPRNRATTTEDGKAEEAARLFPPPQGLAAAPPPPRIYPGQGAPATTPALATVFPPPDPLPTRAGPVTGGAHTWDPRPTAKPDDALQVAVLSPARPPAKPVKQVALRPMAKPQARDTHRTRSDDRSSTRLQVLYPAAAVEIPGGSTAALDSLAREIGPDSALRVQLAAYADDRGRSASKARRTSLSRALAIRSFLIDRGIAAGRIDVRALGNTSQGGEADRVDVVVLDK